MWNRAACGLAAHVHCRSYDGGRVLPLYHLALLSGLRSPVPGRTGLEIYPPYDVCTLLDLRTYRTQRKLLLGYKVQSKRLFDDADLPAASRTFR